MKANVYCGFMRNTIVKCNTDIVGKYILKSKCLECNGTGQFSCGIPEEDDICVQCKGTGYQYYGTI